MAALALVLLLLDQSIPLFLEMLNKEMDKGKEAPKQIKRLGERFERIKPQIEAADRIQAVDGSAKIYLDHINHLVNDFEDLMDEWLTSSSSSSVVDRSRRSTSKKEVWADKYLLASCSCFRLFTYKRSLSAEIREIDERLDKITGDYLLINNYPRVAEGQPQRPEFSSVISVSQIRGRDQEKDELVQMLGVNGIDDEIGTVVVSITGMMGIGKTTLAQFVFNDERVQNHFDYKIWVSVSNPINDKRRLAKAIIEAIEKQVNRKNKGKEVSNNDRKSIRKEDGEFYEWDLLHNHLKDCLEKKKFLLVLDDVSGIDSVTWDDLKLCLEAGAAGSRVLITTQIQDLATMMDSNRNPYLLNRLSEENCWLLLRDSAMQGKKEEEIKKIEREGRKLAKKCHRLPLAIKILGRSMRNKTNAEWQDVSDIWNLNLVRESLLPPLYFSYFALKPELRRCFAYCAFLPNDYQMNKSILIKQWMAQGFLGKEVDDQMEKTGEEYFDSLDMASFLQHDKDGGNYDDIISYKLHPLVHAFAQLQTGNECCFIENSTSLRENIIGCSRIRHTTLVLRDENVTITIRPDLYQAKKLRTLKIRNSRWTALAKIPPEVFHHFRFLRTLDLSFIGLQELPSNIDELILLKFLDLSGSRFESLPKTLCNLKNLQTLILNDCEELNKLPQEIKELITLRHLQIQNTPLLLSLPEGIWRLVALRTLSKFIVTAPGSGKGSKIGELKPLNLLQGHLRINGLKRVKRGSDATEAEMEKKNQLRSLCLNFEIDELSKPETVEIGKDVLEGLRPNQRLKKFEIHHYFGSTFSSWMMDSTLDNLRILILKDCINCTQFPPLGKRPFLKEVRIENMDGVEDIGLEFYGIRTANDSGYVEGTFLQLKVLHIDGMAKLRTWDWSAQGDRVSMPSLTHLCLRRCPRLKTLSENVFPPTLDKQHITTDYPGLLQTTARSAM